MKRPKIKDMNPLELARFRILQARRASRRALRYLDFLTDYQDHPGVIRSRALAESVIAVTKPAWVAKAPLSHCGEVLHFIGYHQTPHALN